MSRVFVIADLHFGHKKLASLRGFADTKSHDDALVAAWNRVVTKRDVTYVLGDVFHPERVQELLGTKKLALGNHDQRPITSYLGLFSQVRAMFEFNGCLLTHIPVHPSQFARYDLNVHGHVHTHRVDDARYIPVSIEHCRNMEPMLLNQLLHSRREFLQVRSTLTKVEP